MNKRAVILLLICFVLAAATVTLRYIESEKEKIKAQFVPPPRVEPKRVRSGTTTVYLSQEQPGGEEGIPAGGQPDTVPLLQNGAMPPEATQAAAQGETPGKIRPRSQRVEQDELREPSIPALIEEQAVQKRKSALEEDVVTSLEEDVVTSLEEDVVTSLEEEVPVPQEAGERVQEEETGVEPAEDVADEGEDADDESGREADADDEEDVSPKPESEITSGKDEQVPPEEVGEEGEYVEGGEEGGPFEEGLEGQADEIAGEGEEVIPSEEEEFPLDGENVLGEGEEVFLDGEE